MRRVPEKDPFRAVDDAARALARRLVDEATFAALAVLDPSSGAPSVTRVALATDPSGAPVSLISTLSAHTQALLADPVCALLVGEPAERGDPLTHPRLTLHARAQFIAREAPEQPALRDHYLSQRPKAKLYIDFGDFSLVRFQITEALMNGGFGKAYKLAPGDLI
jgi:putative heme iron utilization protein